MILRSAKLRIPGGIDFGLERVRQRAATLSDPISGPLFGKTRQELPSHSYSVTTTAMSQHQARILADAFRSAKGPVTPLLFTPDVGPVVRAFFAESQLQIDHAGHAQVRCTFSINVNPQ